jgi:hypothetical protein
MQFAKTYNAHEIIKFAVDCDMLLNLPKLTMLHEIINFAVDCLVVSYIFGFHCYATDLTWNDVALMEQFHCSLLTEILGYASQFAKTYNAQ